MKSLATSQWWKTQVKVFELYEELETGLRAGTIAKDRYLVIKEAITTLYSDLYIHRRYSQTEGLPADIVQILHILLRHPSGQSMLHAVYKVADNRQQWTELEALLNHLIQAVGEGRCPLGSVNSLTLPGTTARPAPAVEASTPHTQEGSSGVQVESSVHAHSGSSEHPGPASEPATDSISSPTFREFTPGHARSWY